MARAAVQFTRADGGWKAVGVWYATPGVLLSRFLPDAGLDGYAAAIHEAAAPVSADGVSPPDWESFIGFGLGVLRNEAMTIGEVEPGLTIEETYAREVLGLSADDAAAATLPGRPDVTVVEADDDHPYGPWAGGSKAQGGHPVAAGGGGAPLTKAQAREQIADLKAAHQRIGDQWKGSAARDSIFGAPPLHIVEFSKTETVKPSGEPHSIRVTRARGKMQVAYRDDDGRDVVRVSGGAGSDGRLLNIDGVQVRPGAERQRWASRAYDAIVDREPSVRLIGAIARSEAGMTPEGYRFAGRWVTDRHNRMVERLRAGEFHEAGDDHFYGAWSGGSKGAGGHPAGGGLAQTEAPAFVPPLAQAQAAQERVAPLKGEGYWQPHTDEKIEYALANAARAKAKIDGNEAEVEALARSRYFRDKWKGEPGSIQIFAGPHEAAYFVHVGPDGRPTGYVSAHVTGSQRSIVQVGILPSKQGKGAGTAMYDAIQDGGHANLYEMIGKGNGFTAPGKAFAESWLRHRIEVESQRAGIREADGVPKRTPLEWAKWALAQVLKAKVTPDGMPSPEEDAPVREASSDDDHPYGHWVGGKKSEGGHIEVSPGAAATWSSLKGAQVIRAALAKGEETSVGANLIQAIHHGQPTTVDMYRGVTMPKGLAARRYKEGSEVTLNLASFDTNRRTAEHFADARRHDPKAEPVVFVLQKGAKVARISGKSFFDMEENEHVTAGRFRVVLNSKGYNPYPSRYTPADPRTIYLEQIGTFAGPAEVKGIREASDDHFYGPWSGGGKSEGGHPDVGGGGLFEQPVARSAAQLRAELKQAALQKEHAASVARAFEGAHDPAWRAANQARYDSDHEFARTVDAVTAFTHGDYRSMHASVHHTDASYRADVGPMRMEGGYQSVVKTVAMERQFTQQHGWSSLNFKHSQTYAEAQGRMERVVAHAPKVKGPLYRGERRFGGAWEPAGGHFSLDSMPKVGDVVTAKYPTSMSRSKRVANSFAVGTGGKPKGSPALRGHPGETEFRIISEIHGARGIDVAALSSWKQAEVIGAGRFKVTKVTVGTAKYRMGASTVVPVLMVMESVE